jgi:hypothetical protein
MTVLEIVQLKLKDTGISSEICELAVDEVAQVIKNYCNIDSIPEALKYTWANMAVDAAKYQYASTNNDTSKLDDISVGDVSSIKIGDTNISFANQGQGATTERERAVKSHNANLDSLVMNYKDQLNKFRRMVW